MKKTLILILILTACTYEPEAARYVIDGDTFATNNGKIIRLQGIDSPEKGDANYDKAAYELQKRLPGKITYEGNETDRYGRQVRFVHANGKNVNIEMVKEGWARVMMHKGTKYEKELEQAQEKAKQQKKGIWKVNDNSYKRLSHRCVQLGCPEGTIAVASKQGEVYYNCACSTANLITKENLECLTTLEQAIEKGLKETRKC